MPRKPKTEPVDLTLDMSLESAKKTLPTRTSQEMTLDHMAKGFGSREKFVEACRVSDRPEVTNFIRAWEGLGEEDRHKMRLSDLCKMVGLAPDKLLEYVVPAAFRWGSNAAKFLMFIKQAEAMEASIETAKIIGSEGFKDREKQLESTGVWKSGGGPLVNINLQGEMDSFEDDINQTIDVTPEP